jgi:hypothetical protein
LFTVVERDGQSVLGDELASLDDLHFISGDISLSRSGSARG